MKNEELQFIKVKSFKFLTVIFTFSFLLFNFSFANAASFTYVSDLISTSAPSAISTHMAQFTVTNSVPASGEILITPQGGFFNIPADFDYTDIDFAISTSSGFIDRSLASSADATNDGVSVVSGSSGSILIELNSSEGITAGSSVQIKLGSNAIYDYLGDQNISNPSSAGSYKINLETRNSSSVVIDSASAMVAIINPVTAGPIIIVRHDPIRSNGLPSGEIPAGSANIELSLNTNEPATCKYATTTGVSYSNMPNIFSVTGSSFIHTVVRTGFVDGQSYNFYVRCIDEYNLDNLDDYAISFSLKATPVAPTSGSASGGGGAGDIIGGSQKLYLSSLALGGWAYPLSVIDVLKDGEKYGSLRAKSDGSFEHTVTGLERGTYNFSIYATDVDGRKSSSFSVTLFVAQGTNNRISYIVIPPTIELEKEEIELGGKAVVFDNSAPGSKIELIVNLQGKNISLDDIKKFTATSSKGVIGVTDGYWEIPFDSSGFKKGTYELKARNIVSENAESGFSRVLFLGVGEEPAPDFSLRSDLNKDGKVNLVDFSIMLVYWGTSDANADINSDGDVNLADFSIMLFNWTG